MTTLLFELPDNLALTVRPGSVSFTAYVPDLSAHIRFTAPSLVGRKLLEAFEQDFLDARLEVTGEFDTNNTFTVHEWEAHPLP
jgi:hypothetical protein